MPSARHAQITIIENISFKDVTFTTSTLLLHIFKNCKFQNCKFTSEEDAQYILYSNNCVSQPQITNFCNCSLHECEFVHAKIDNICFKDSILENNIFTECHMNRIDFGDTTEIYNCIFNNVQASITKFSKMRHCSFTDSTINYAVFRSIHDTEYVNCIMQDVNMTYTIITRTNFHRCDMTNASYSNALFSSVEFKYCDLERGFEDATFYDVKIRTSVSRGKNIDLSGATIKTPVIIEVDEGEKKNETR